ncbi:MAG: hypothetical protein ABI854_06445, partial [Betaproteobacteria bacterium]
INPARAIDETNWYENFKTISGSGEGNGARPRRPGSADPPLSDPHGKLYMASTAGRKSNANQGCFTPFVGPAIISSAALRCTADSLSAGSGGIRPWKAT